MQLTNRLIYPSIIVSIYIASLIIQNLLFLNWDVASLLQATKLLLNGGSYVNDIFTPNPPMILYLYTPVIIFSKLLNLNIVDVFTGYIYLLCTASLVMCYPFVKNYFRHHEHDLTRLFMATLAIGYLIIPIYEFGNRDHLLLILSMPYLLAVVSRLSGNKIDPKFALLIGLFAGIGFAIKPQFLITLALIELYCMYFQKNIFAWWRIETLVIAAILITYAATTLLFHANFINIIVPFLLRNYYPAISQPLGVITKYPATVFSFMAIAVYLLAKKNKKQEILYTVLLVALVGSIASIYLQRTLFYYHFIPALTIASLLSVMTIYLYASGEHNRSTDNMKIALLAAAFITIDVYLYYFAWSYIVLCPWYFYTFFAVMFFLLFYTNKIRMNVLPILIRVFLIVMVVSEFSVLLRDAGYFNHRFLFVIILMSALYASFAMQLYRNFIHHILVVSLVVSMFYMPVMYSFNIFMGPREYKESTLRILSEFINNRKPTASIYTFTAAIYFTYPVIFYSEATPAQRFDQLWPLLIFAKKENLAGKKMSPDFIKDKKLFVDMVVGDMHRNKPDLIFVDNRFKNDLEILACFSEDPNFRKEWGSYRFVTTLDLGTINFAGASILVYERINS